MITIKVSVKKFKELFKSNDDKVSKYFISYKKETVEDLLFKMTNNKKQCITFPAFPGIGFRLKRK